ncbi:hypothetical protein TNIN_85062 [Trichonephila inaurata madagascariensis]|uniref:C2H2-type domain-containing protein n=1 Tax=Trichonephila inaurata madagascariensis TaxID=2747483 RepID=A0A8X6MM94_9ARAC|nr:hypothetical protein TNIN_85062 [Trichonephila inaurata madagascariensis]
MNIDIRGLYDTSLRKNVGAEVFPFACPQCPYTSHYKSNLNRHIRKHSGERPFVCKIDFDGSWIKDSDASSSEQKKRHLHHCTLCSYATSNKCHLKTHFRKHTGERPYLCKVCGKGYSSKQNLQSHEYLHAMQKLHTCKICKENFRNKSALEYHMANQHQFS